MNTNTETAETGTATAATSAAQPSPAKGKWTSQVGPRLTKRANQALKEINFQHGAYREISGIKGVSEKTWCYHILFGGHRADVALAWQTFGDKFGWTLTRDNLEQIVTEAEALVAVLAANAPVKDSRQTQEEHDAQQASRDEARRQHETEDRQRQQARESATLEHRQAHPWAIQSGSSHARGAANLKILLQQTFPGISFSVKSESYSGGDSISVHWECGPTTQEVEAISAQFQEGHFDGMTDCYNHASTGFHDWMGGAKYVKTARHLSDAVHRAIAEEICKANAVPLPDTWPAFNRWEFKVGDQSLQEQVNELYYATSFPPGAVVVSLEAANEANDYKAKLLLHAPAHPSHTAAAQTSPSSSATTGATVRRNLEHDGVEVSFPSKPEAAVIAGLKAAGFRWSMRSKVWYKKYGSHAWAEAHRLASLELPAETGQQPPDPTDLAYEDQCASACGQ